MATKEAYNIAEVCQSAGSSRTSIYAAIKAGSLIARKRGRRTVVLREDLLDWLRALPKMSTSNAQTRVAQ